MEPEVWPRQGWGSEPGEVMVIVAEGERGKDRPHIQKSLGSGDHSGDFRRVRGPGGGDHRSTPAASLRGSGAGTLHWS